eukprot:10927564-Alexandrium_andersonii.AAC.1
MWKVTQEVARGLLLEPLPSGDIKQIAPRHQTHSDHPPTTALRCRRRVGGAIDNLSLIHI